MMKNPIVIDLETVSLVDLKKHDAFNYAASPSTHITVISWRDIEGLIWSVVHPKFATDLVEPDQIKAFKKLLAYQGRFIAHNANFENTILNAKLKSFCKHLGVKNKIRKYKITDFIDSLTLSNVFRGPAALDKAAEYFGADVLKDAKGKKIMLATCVGKEKEPNTMKTSVLKIPAEWIELEGTYFKAGNEVYSKITSYCETDVAATWELYQKLSLRTGELGTFLPDTVKGIETTLAMNERGVLVDNVWADKLAELYEEIQEKLVKLSLKHFGLNPGQRVKIAEFLQSKGYKTAGTGKEALEESYANNEGFVTLKKALKEYSKLNKRALSKISAAKDKKTEDNVLKHMFKFCGGYTTGRFASYGVQLQNLPRIAEDFTIERAKKIISGKIKKPTPDEVVSCIRGALVPRPGYKFFIADLSQIEIRGLYHKIKEYDRIQALHEGLDAYCDFASGIYGREIDKKSTERQVAKVFLLELGYGAGKEKAAKGYAKAIGEEVSIKRVEDEIYNPYHRLYPGIKKLWYEYNDAINIALQTGRDLKVPLDSGRVLNFGPVIERLYEDEETKEERVVKCIHNGKKWSPIYGSKIFQNVIQAECRDIFLIKMNALHDTGAKIVMQVHDELIVEVPEKATLESCVSAWNKAGSERVKELFPHMILDSDCVFTDRYWSH